ncbi:MAG: FG-GAP-like repeat-containing protein, partial [Thermoplasmata archaeon]
MKRRVCKKTGRKHGSLKDGITKFSSTVLPVIILLVTTSTFLGDFFEIDKNIFNNRAVLTSELKLFLHLVNNNTESTDHFLSRMVSPLGEPWITSAYSYSTFGYRVFACDFNGDSVSDIICAAPNYTTGTIQKGRVWGWTGNESYPEIFQTQYNIPQFGESFGYSIYAARIRTGLGRDVVFISYYENGAPKVVPARFTGSNFLNGSSIEPGVINSTSFGFAYTSGDYDGDGIIDLIISDPYFNNTGSPSPSVWNTSGAFWYIKGDSSSQLVFSPVLKQIGSENSFLGLALASGRFNNDNKTDLAVLNKTHIQIWTGTGDSSMLTYNTSVLTGTGGTLTVLEAGDINGDGYSDLIASDPQNNTVTVLINDASAGQISFSTYTFSTAGHVPGDRFGQAILIRDLDYDGMDDFIISAPFEQSGGSNRTGSLYYYNGAQYMAGNRMHYFKLTAPDTVDTSYSLMYYLKGFGYSLAGGDFTNDGNPDILIGAPFSDSDTNTSIGAVVPVFAPEIIAGPEFESQQVFRTENLTATFIGRDYRSNIDRIPFHQVQITDGYGGWVNVTQSTITSYTYQGLSSFRIDINNTTTISDVLGWRSYRVRLVNNEGLRSPWYYFNNSAVVKDNRPVVTNWTPPVNEIFRNNSITIKAYGFDVETPVSAFIPHVYYVYELEGIPHPIPVLNFTDAPGADPDYWWFNITFPTTTPLGNCTFYLNFTAQDNTSDTASFNLLIKNNRPVVTNISMPTTSVKRESETLEVSIFGDDIEDGQNLTCTLHWINEGQFGRRNINTTYNTARGCWIGYFHPTYEFAIMNYIISASLLDSDNGLSDYFTYAEFVRVENTPPNITVDHIFNASEGSLLIVNLSGCKSDWEEDVNETTGRDSLVWSFIDLYSPTGADIQRILFNTNETPEGYNIPPEYINKTLGPDEFAFYASPNFFGVASFNVSLTDIDGGVTNATIYLEWFNVNDPPKILNCS